MILKLFILSIAALYFLAPSINGQGCIPTQVTYISISAESILFWQLDPNEPCPIDEFIVDIVGDREDEYHFKVKKTSVDVSFLQICEKWTFVVTPVSAGVVGYERRLVDYVPIPPHADLSLWFFDVTQLKPREVLLTWDLTDLTLEECKLEYRIVIEDLVNGNIQDLYVSNNWALLDNLSPCVSYEFSVRAINRAFPTIEGPRKFYRYDMPAQAQVAPTVNNVEMGATTADLRFNLESSNRCPVKTLFVESDNNFNISIPLENTEGERPLVEVNLKGLIPDSMYLLKVSVDNLEGVSSAAQLAVQTLPLNKFTKM